MAFSGFVRQVSSSSLPAEQKVLQLRKVAAAGDRRCATSARCCAAFERAKTFQSFLVVSSFLDDPELANDAAGAVMRIALPSAGAPSDGLSGRLSSATPSTRCCRSSPGAESDYDKENIRTYLQTMPQDDGFVPLFNGKDLPGGRASSRIRSRARS